MSADVPGLQLTLIAVVTLGCAASIAFGRHSPAQFALAAGVIALAVGGTWWAETQASTRLASRQALEAEIPATLLRSPDPASAEYVTSDRCRGCHPSQYASWHDSYHRTMTQRASPEAILAPFEGQTLAARDRAYHLERRGDEYWVQMADPDWERDRLDRGGRPEEVAQPPMRWKRVVMTTGSHHMQTYWVASRRDGRLFNFPWLWLVEDQRWIPREDGFIRPPDGPRTFDVWHGACIECHAVAGEKNRGRRGEWRPGVAELGIACEACHGPAEEHVRANQDPLRRLRLRASDTGDPTIVNPARLEAEASSQVCGQCHGINLIKSYIREQGPRFRPGGDLRDTRIVLRATEHARKAETNHSDPQRVLDQQHLEKIVEQQLARNDSFLRDRFWPDGMVRVSGREQNGLIESACFESQALSCLNCHSMHESDPSDQLAAAPDGPEGSDLSDRACLSCHASFAEDLEAHTHHAPDSSGSRCYNCHMPHTVYGLMKSIRSHWIDSPNAATTQRTGRPDACSLCHLDQTLAWTATQLETRYGQPAPAFSEDDRTLSGVARWGIRGNAHQRSMVAWHLGWPDAGQAVSGDDWRPFFLGHLLNDPYPAVRYGAAQSLSTIRPDLVEGFDFLAPADLREAASAAVMTQTAPRAGHSPARPELLRDVRGGLDQARLSKIAAARDDQEMDLRE